MDRSRATTAPLPESAHPSALQLGAIALLLSGSVIAGCACDEPFDPGADGNVIVSDARVDGGLDLGVDDLGDAGPTDEGFADDGGLDADELDGSLFDDAGALDASPGDAGDLCSVTSTANLTTGEAIAQIATYLGQIVVIEGTINQGTTVCTAMACPPTDPCCNTCQASLELDRVLPILGSSCLGFTPGCSGDDCGLICRPLVIGAPGHYRGRLIDTSGPAFELFEVLP